MIDDDSDIVNLFKDVLESNDYEVNGFTNPLEALQHYLTNCNQYGLVISDIRMPGMNGFDLLKNIKKINAAVSFFLMSANDTIDFSELEDIKIDGFIQKPIPIKKLLSIIEKNFNQDCDVITLRLIQLAMTVKTEINFMEIVNKVIRDYDNNFVDNIKYHESVEIALLMWVKFVSEKVDNLYSLRTIIQDATTELNYEMRNTKDVIDVTRLSYAVDILKTCLFIIALDLEKQEASEMYLV